MGVKLSICISTVGRANFLRQTVASILPQMTPETELVILDVGSTDATRGYCRLVDGVRYIREEGNQPFDKKYARFGGLASGEYLWLFSDDDIMLPGAIAAAMEGLKTSPVLCLANAEVRDQECATVLQKEWVASVDGYPELVEYYEGEDSMVMASLGSLATCLGANIVRRDWWRKLNHHKYAGTLFGYFGAIFDSPIPGRVVFLSRPLWAARLSNSTWFGADFELWLITLPRIVWGFRHIANSAKVQVTPRQPWRSWKRLFASRAMGHYSPLQYRAFIKRGVVAAIIARVPVWVANRVAKTALAFRRDRPTVTLYDLDRVIDRGIDLCESNALIDFRKVRRI